MATGDSDLIYGSYVLGEAAQSDGTVSSLYGDYNTAVIDHTGGYVANAHATYSYMSLTASGGTMANAYGAYSKVLIGAAHDINTPKVTGVYGEIEIDPNTTTTTTVTNAYCFEAQFDNDTGANVTVNNGYLYYGNYAGDLPNNAFGVYIADAVDNYFAGNVRTAANYQIGSTTVIDSNRSIYATGLDVTGAALASDSFQIDSSSSGFLVGGGSTGTTAIGKAAQFCWIFDARHR